MQQPTASNNVVKVHTPLICGGHSRPVPFLSYSGITEDGFFLISACLDGKPMLRNGQTGDWIGTFVGHKGAVWAATLSNNALLGATGSADYTAKIWDTLTGECKQSFEHKRIVKTVDFSKDEKLLLTGGQEKTLRLWDIATKSEVGNFGGHTESIKIAQWLDNNIFISGGGDSVLRVWDMRTKEQVNQIASQGQINSLEISRDGKVITMAAGKTAAILDATAFAPLKSFAFAMELSSACLHPTATRFVVGGSADFWDHVCDYATGKEIEVHKGHHGPVHCVKYAPDGETFASGSEDGTVRLIQNEIKPYGLWQVTSDAAAAGTEGAAP